MPRIRLPTGKNKENSCSVSRICNLAQKGICDEGDSEGGMLMSILMLRCFKNRQRIYKKHLYSSRIEGVSHQQYFL